MTDQIVRELAATLGVTVEHLWEVLITQAPISGTTNLTGLTIITAGAIWFTRLTYRKTRRIKDEDGITVKYPEWDDDTVWIPVGASWMLILCAWALGVTGIIAAFFNPDYWALMQILK